MNPFKRLHTSVPPPLGKSIFERQPRVTVMSVIGFMGMRDRELFARVSKTTRYYALSPEVSVAECNITCDEEAKIAMRRPEFFVRTPRLKLAHSVPSDFFARNAFQYATTVEIGYPHLFGSLLDFAKGLPALTDLTVRHIRIVELAYTAKAVDCLIEHQRDAPTLRNLRLGFDLFPAAAYPLIRPEFIFSMARDQDGLVETLAARLKQLRVAGLLSSFVVNIAKNGCPLHRSTVDTFWRDYESLSPLLLPATDVFLRCSSHHCMDVYITQTHLPSYTQVGTLLLLSLLDMHILHAISPLCAPPPAQRFRSLLKPLATVERLTLQGCHGLALTPVIAPQEYLKQLQVKSLKCVLALGSNRTVHLTHAQLRHFLSASLPSKVEHLVLGFSYVEDSEAYKTFYDAMAGTGQVLSARPSLPLLTDPAPATLHSSLNRVDITFPFATSSMPDSFTAAMRLYNEERRAAGLHPVRFYCTRGRMIPVAL